MVPNDPNMRYENYKFDAKYRRFRRTVPILIKIQMDDLDKANKIIDLVLKVLTEDDGKDKNE